MRSDFLSVHIDDRLIVDGSEIENRMFASMRLMTEIALIPHTTFVEKQTFALSVPVARNLQTIGTVEIVFHQILGACGFLIPEESRTALLHTVVVETFFLYIYYTFPITIQRFTRTAKRIINQWNFYSLDLKARHGHQYHYE